MTVDMDRVLLGICVFVSITLSQSQSVISNGVYRGDEGSTFWPYMYRGCSGIRQSPINVDTTRAVFNPVLQDLRLFKYNVPSEVTMSNDGRTAKIDFSNVNASIELGYNPGKYAMKELHFHWGRNNQVGSEHTINQMRAPMEMHVVHYAKKYGSYEMAKQHIDGIVVLAFFFKISNGVNNLSPIVNRLDHIRYKGDKVKIPSLAISDLLPPLCHQYYSYSGSLTVPRCNQVVTWLLFLDTMPISERQLSSFRYLYMLSRRDVFDRLQQDSSKENDLVLLDNCRILQPTNARIVYTNLDKTKTYIDTVNKLSDKTPFENELGVGWCKLNALPSRQIFNIGINYWLGI